MTDDDRHRILADDLAPFLTAAGVPRHVAERAAEFVRALDLAAALETGFHNLVVSTAGVAPLALDDDGARLAVVKFVADAVAAGVPRELAERQVCTVNLRVVYEKLRSREAAAKSARDPSAN